MNPHSQSRKIQWAEGGEGCCLSAEGRRVGSGPWGMSCIAKSQQPSQMRHSQSQTHCITILPPQKSESLHTWADYSRFQRCVTHGLTPPPPRHRRSKIWEGHHSSPRGEPFRGISSPNSPGPIDPLRLCRRKRAARYRAPRNETN